MDKSSIPGPGNQELIKRLTVDVKGVHVEWLLQVAAIAWAKQIRETVQHKTSCHLYIYVNLS